MAKNDERMIFGIGFDLATGVNEVIKQWEGKESKRLQKALDKKPLKISLEIKKNFITELRDFVRVTREVANAQRQINKAKKEELDIAAKAASVKAREANARAANVRATVQEATQQDQINKKKADAAYAEQRLANAKKNGIAATNAQNTAYKTQSNYLSRLLTRMAAYFSIHQAFNFLRNIREVTAEFELQRVALGALIQDAHEANIIFEQIKVQAVKSPYEVKDLVNYTKQLAAYGVEADELMGTMNRLADISAGLGADMNRIILAYGQIQAAGVLKGTELRQLTELGIPMVDLLAEYYSTLRNEVVTTSEVFDMISDKEIPFQAVKDILEDLTSEGGRFYQMQAKQAETLKGQWSNMKDTLSIMFDEMGRSEEVRGLLEGYIDLVKHLALNWREVWSVVKGLGYTYATLKGSAAIIRLLTIETISQAAAKRNLRRADLKYQAVSFKTNGLLKIRLALERAQAYLTRRVALATNFATASMWKLVRATLAFIATNPIGLIMGIASAIGIYKLATDDGVDAMDAFRERQRELVKESVQNTAMLVSNFKRLANEVINSADGSEQQNQALRRLKQQYGEIFPEWKLTVDYLRNIADEGNNVSDSFNNMASSIRAFASEEMRQTLIENYQTQLNDQFKDTFAKLTDEVGANYSEAIGVILQNFDKDQTLSEFINEVMKSYLNAQRGIDLDPENYDWKLLLNLAKAFYEVNGEIDQMMKNFDNLDPRLSEVNNQIKELKNTLTQIDETTGGDTPEAVVTNVEQKRKEAIDEATRKLLEDEGFKKVHIAVTLDWVIANLDKVKAEAEKRGIELSDAFYSGLQAFRGFSGDYDDIWREDLANMIEYLDDGKRRVEAYSSDQISNFGNLNTALTSVAERYKELQKNIDQLKKTADALKLPPKDKQDVKLIEEYRKEISKTKTIMTFLYGFLKKYGGLDLLNDDDKKKKVNPQIKQLEDELSMVEKIYKKYEEYRKTMGDTKARALVEQYFEGVEFKWLDKAFKPTELKAQAQEALRIIKTFWGDTKKAEQNIQFKIGDIDYNTTKTELEDNMKKLSDDISRTKTAQEFFDRMLGMTGDKELSATLTMSVYGTTGDDLQKLMSQQVEEAFKNLPEGFDITKAMLGGGKFDYNLLESWIEKLPKDDRTLAKSVVDNWHKANADILTDLQKSYEDFMTYEERKKRVAQKYVSERKKIEESLYDKNEKEKLMRASREAEKKELGAIAIEEFKASDDWIKSFEDLENLATPTIERLMTKLKEFITLNKEALTPEQLKSLMGEYDKLYNGLITRNPIQAITDSIKEYKTAMQGVKLAQDALDAAKAMGDDDLIAFAERGLTDAFDEAQKATAKLQKGLNGLSDKFSQAQQFVSSFADTLGISEDTQFGAFLNGISDALGGVSKAFAFAQLAVQLFDGTIKTMLASNPIGWILLAVSAIISAVQAIANARVKRIDQDIEHIEDRLDSLSYAYDRLQKSAEKAFGTEYIQNYNRQLENLEAQVEAYEKQLSLERSKGKKADEEKIKEYQNQIRDTKDAIEDMYGSLSEHFLGQDIASAARDFASAWIDAYKEFSNTTDAMKAKFQDMIQNMIVESLLAKVMEKALEPVFAMIDNMQEGDFYSSSFWQDVMSSMQTATENGVVGAENIMSMLEQMGINLRGLGGEMTGISRDIATASEESILGLAAGINTQNFYISQVPTKLDTIIGLLRGDGAMPQGSAITLQDVMIAQNQFLSHLPTIAQHTAETVAECKAIVVETRRTADALERVIKPRGTQSTYTMNTTLN